jgi:uncharacterized damage-inducible protein DinB
MSTGVPTGEHADLLEALAKQRHHLCHTTRGLTDDQARQRTTASELCLGGLVKHVAMVERNWATFMVKGPSAMPDTATMAEADRTAWTDTFRLLPDETLAGVLDAYAAVSRETDLLVSGIPDLAVSQPLPRAPWFEKGARWSARRTLAHIISETAQHTGHADIIRESLDGAKSMG